MLLLQLLLLRLLLTFNHRVGSLHPYAMNRFEADLMTQWNPYIDTAKCIKKKKLEPADDGSNDSTSEVWHYADSKFWPIPIPPLLTVVHMTIQDKLESEG